jgi:hypothetical protein
MDLYSKKQLIEEGKKTLELGGFPNEILENIKDVRLRKEVFDGIFYDSKEKFEDLTDKEQKIRKSRLKIIQGFTNYMTSFSIYQKSAVILIFIGMLTLISHTAFNIRDNLVFGIISLIIGIILFTISLKNERIKKMLYISSILYVLLYLIELIGWGIPSNYFFIENLQIDFDNTTGGRHRGIPRGLFPTIVNSISPYVYLVTRFIVGAMLFLAYKKHVNFKKLKAEFEAASGFY